jgi:hypothetical protein
MKAIGSRLRDYVDDPARLSSELGRVAHLVSAELVDSFRQRVLLHVVEYSSVMLTPSSTKLCPVRCPRMSISFPACGNESRRVPPESSRLQRSSAITAGTPFSANTLTAVNFRLVASFTATTVALETTSLVGSLTTPPFSAVFICANDVF